MCISFHWLPLEFASLSPVALLQKHSFILSALVPSPASLPRHPILSVPFSLLNCLLLSLQSMSSLLLLSFLPPCFVLSPTLLLLPYHIPYTCIVTFPSHFPPSPPVIIPLSPSVRSLIDRKSLLLLSLYFTFFCPILSLFPTHSSSIYPPHVCSISPSTLTPTSPSVRPCPSGG